MSPPEVEYLRARLDEAESAARKTADHFIRFEAKPGDWTRLMCDPVLGPFGGQTATRDVATGLYVGKMSDPARVLREVAADRKLLAAYAEAEAEMPRGIRDDFDDSAVAYAHGRRDALREAVQLRAAIWSDHLAMLSPQEPSPSD